MSRKKMRRYLKKPKSKSRNSDQTNWRFLYEKALDMTMDIKSTEDPRVRLLRGYPKNKAEQVLRKLSIVSVEDLKREFEGDTEK